ncbi:MAG: EthD domain-containing protein [Gammaproteobacteria bacterium]|jgi:hypothetical protein|nr:EthD domain-containing protein [Gammaproteobacteria bacterium]MBT5202164.1 EthD domain-containing protein [Gammaproteobacteria bacterium]MBT5602262.1 EthD domain-containing protein [Gammaproteobacteria bacterium]
MQAMALEFCLAFSNKDTAKHTAEMVGGRLYEDVNDRDLHNPFAALLCTTHPDLSALLSAADVGAYLIDRREMKTRDLVQPQGPQPGAVGVFTLVANTDMGHDAADRHWRDGHTPLALSIHLAMSNYAQLSVLHCFAGPLWDGFALCGFESEQDLRTRFFASREGEKIIAEDVAKFADTKLSPRRVVAVETRFVI